MRLLGCVALLTTEPVNSLATEFFSAQKWPASMLPHWSVWCRGNGWRFCSNSVCVIVTEKPRLHVDTEIKI